jgi:hypothetical protein
LPILLAVIETLLRSAPTSEVESNWTFTQYEYLANIHFLKDSS